MQTHIDEKLLVRELAEALANAGLLRTAIAKATGAAPEKEPSDG